MGFFDLFSSKPTPKKIEKAKNVMLNEHHQLQVRQDAIHELIQYGTDDAIHALIERLGVNFRDTTKNEQEQSWIQQVLVEHFKDRSIELLKKFVMESEGKSLSRTIYTLKSLIGQEEMTEFLITSLERFNPKDHRTVETRLQIIDALDEQPGEIIQSVLPYVMDHNDDVRVKVINLIEDRIIGIEGDHVYIIKAFIEAMTDPYAGGRITRAVAQSLIRLEANLSDYADEIKDQMPEGYRLVNGLIKPV